MKKIQLVFKGGMRHQKISLLFTSISRYFEKTILLKEEVEFFSWNKNETKLYQPILIESYNNKTYEIRNNNKKTHTNA